MSVMQRNLGPPQLLPSHTLHREQKLTRHMHTHAHTHMHTHTSTRKLINSSGWVDWEEALNNAPQRSTRAPQRPIRSYKVWVITRKKYTTFLRHLISSPRSLASLKAKERDLPLLDQAWHCVGAWVCLHGPEGELTLGFGVPVSCAWRGFTAWE